MTRLRAPVSRYDNVPRQNANNPSTLAYGRIEHLEPYHLGLGARKPKVDVAALLGYGGDINNVRTLVAKSRALHPHGPSGGTELFCVV
jgi:hypothetical protein